jgi:hypothetical protein
MEYMLVFFETEAEMNKGDDAATAGPYYGAWKAYIGAMAESGCMRGGNGLLHAREGTSVRVTNGQRQVQDGPYPDTREHLGGYVIIDVPGRDQALEWAARAPCAAHGHVQVRPVLPDEAMAD